MEAKREQVRLLSQGPEVRTVDGKVELGGFMSSEDQENLASDSHSLTNSMIRTTGVSPVNEGMAALSQKHANIMFKEGKPTPDFTSMALKLNSARFDHISPANKIALIRKFGGKTSGLTLDPKFLLRGRLKRGNYAKPERIAPKTSVARSILQNQSNRHMNNELINENKKHFYVNDLRNKG